MTRWLWHLRELGRRAGMMGLAGLVLLLAAGLLDALWLHPEVAGLVADQARLARLKRLPRSMRAVMVPATVSPLSLPTRSAVPALLNTLTRLAKEQGVDLSQGQFSLGPLPGSGLLRLQARYPVKADYPALRAILAQSLKELPSLVLDGFEFKRPDIGATEVDAELRLSLYLQARP